MKKLTLILASILFSVSGHAATGKKFLTLEDAVVAQAKQWQKTGKTKPIMTDDGKIIFPYGEYMPHLVCAPLRACDIELEPGELVISTPLIGDGVRWKITKSESGPTENRIVHVVVKPVDTGLETNLIIPTDRRTYQIELRSTESEKDYMNRIGFYYPDKVVTDWEKSAREAEQKKADKEKPVVGELPSITPDKLDFGYKVDAGDAKIKPIRVFNDGAHVWIQMPEEMKADEAPVLLVLDKDEKPVLVNYRVKNSYYIVDKLFDQAMMIVGSDGNESKLKISWNKTEKKGWLW